MADHEGYVKLDRNMLRWRWISTPNTAYIFVYLLLKANYKDIDFQGMKIKRGQLVTSIGSLAEKTSLSFSMVRTALDHLRTTGEITSKQYPKYQVITIVNYDLYQDVASRDASKSQANRKQTTSKSQQVNTSNTRERKKENRSLRSQPPSGSKSDRMPGRSEGTVDDIPMEYRKQFSTYTAYYDWRNQ